MKVRVSVVVFTVLCAVVMSVLVWLKVKPDRVGLVPPSTPINSPAQDVAATGLPPQSSSGTAQTAVARTSQPQNPNPPGSAGLQAKGQQMKQALATYNDSDIELYGRVIDQFGEPVAGANVKGVIQINNGSRVGADQATVSTDVNGDFKISGYRGKALGISITKTGYVMATSKTRFVYSQLWSESEQSSSSSQEPAVFQMWRLQGAEPLVQINQKYKFHLADAPLSFDLLSGKIVPAGGDIRVSLQRAPGEVSERTLLDWSVRIEAVDGGLIAADPQDARVMYELPADGYQPVYSFTMSTNTQSWHGALDQLFYIRSRNGQTFSKVTVGISINQQPEDWIWVELHGELNPQGSRNFEADAVAMTGQ